MLDGRLRNNVKPGILVRVQDRMNPRSGTLIAGIVKEVITPEFSHPRGIMVLLENGIEGRVKEIIESKDETAKKLEEEESIKDNIVQLEKDRIISKSDVTALSNQLIKNQEESESSQIPPKEGELSRIDEALNKKEAELLELENKIALNRELLVRGKILDSPKEVKNNNHTTNTENFHQLNYPEIQSSEDFFNLTSDTKMKQDIGILERQFRKIIVDGLKDIPNWWKTRIPEDVRKKALERKEEREKSEVLRKKEEYDAIEFVDFPEYRKIIVKSDNWEEVFSKIFPKSKKLSFEVKMEEIENLRNDTYHNRRISDTDLKRFEVYYTDLMTFMANYERNRNL